MKKLGKILLASTLAMTLFACSSNDAKKEESDGVSTLYFCSSWENDVQQYGSGAGMV